MELLRPLRTGSSGGTPSASDPVTVLVDRRVPATEEATFRRTLDDLVREFDAFPGTSGCLVFRQEAGADVEFSVLQQFATAADHDAWVASPAFARWRAAVVPPVPTPGHVHRYSGMDAFFVTAAAPNAPPRWKMALLLLLAVFPMSLGASRWLGPALADLPFLAGPFLTSVLMVLGMTYVIVPILTKVFERWLSPSPGKRATA